MSKTLQICIALIALATAAGCSKKKEGGEGGGAAKSKSGLAWEPVNYGEMTPSCKKALACCEEFAKQGGASKAEDYNLKCSGPALWKEADCEVDLKSRLAMLEGKPVPDACK